MGQVVVTFDQARKYFEARLGRSIPAHDNFVTLCPFHQDNTPSLSILLKKGGVWKCHAGTDCGRGALLAFEKKMFPEYADRAHERVNGVIGESIFGHGSWQVIGTHEYLSARGIPIMRKIRFLMPDGKKAFSTEHRDEAGRWQKELGNIIPPLYNLPDLITANVVVVTEGEKAADSVKEVIPDVLRIMGRDSARMAATTTYDGAQGQWRDYYSAFFAGKVVLIAGDNDSAGEAYKEKVASRVYPYAESVHYLSFAELGSKADAADFLEMHSVEEFVGKIKKAKRWQPKESGILVPMSDFVYTSQCEYIDWAVDRVVQRGSNGVIGADMKTGKSFAAVDMLLSMACGMPWLGFSVQRPCRVALVSREDNPALTSWRIKHFFQTKIKDFKFHPGIVDDNFYVNSRQQTPELMLDNDEQLDELIQEMKNRKVEFCILDVLNVLHLANENDPTEMRQVMKRIDMIQQKTGAYMGIVHHYSKNGTGNITKMLRGASSIGGWVEWMVGISMADHEKKIRKMEFESKAGPPEPIFYQIESDDFGLLRMSRVDYQEPPQSSKVRTIGSRTPYVD